MDAWNTVPNTVSELVKEGSTMFARIRAALKTLPSALPGHGGVWFNPKTQAVFFSLSEDDSSDIHADWRDKLRTVKGVKSVHGDTEKAPPKDKGPWLRVKTSSIQHVLGPIAQAGGWRSGFPANMMGGPNPLSATLASGVLGAGAGYGLGWLAEKLFPDRYVEPGRLRKTTAILGGLLGAAPGMWSATVNWRHGRGILDPIGARPPMPGSDIAAGAGFDTDKTSSLHYINCVLDTFLPNDPITRKEMDKLAQAFDRWADYGGGGLIGAGSDYVRGIDTDSFNRAIWSDPFTPIPLKGTTSGILEGASQIAGDTTLISPMDVGRLAVGMGTGLASGLIVGKTLGALAGLTPTAQSALQRAGTWAGLITNVVPMILPRTQQSSGYDMAR